jgi:hypothetical protein
MDGPEDAPGLTGLGKKSADEKRFGPGVDNVYKWVHWCLNSFLLFYGFPGGVSGH